MHQCFNRQHTLSSACLHSLYLRCCLLIFFSWSLLFYINKGHFLGGNNPDFSLPEGPSMVLQLPPIHTCYCTSKCIFNYLWWGKTTGASLLSGNSRCCLLPKRPPCLLFTICFIKKQCCFATSGWHNAGILHLPRDYMPPSTFPFHHKYWRKQMSAAKKHLQTLTKEAWVTSCETHIKDFYLFTDSFPGAG